MKKYYKIILPLALALISCGHNQANNVSTSIIDGEIEIPRPPAELKTPQEKAEFILMNFWNPVDFKDTTLTLNESFVEQNFVNFISVFPYAEEASRKKAVNNLLDKTKVDSRALDSFMQVAELYLYSPDSPMRNDDYFLHFMEYIIESSETTESQKEIASYTIENINKNHVGTKATDFNFTDSDGKDRSLHSVFPDRETMLIFYDPDCENCHKVISEIINDPDISQKVSNGGLGVLAVYSGHNKTSWLRDLSSFPKEWIVGHETGQIDESELYDLREMPTIYLLDNDKTVVQKELQYLPFE